MDNLSINEIRDAWDVLAPTYDTQPRRGLLTAAESKRWQRIIHRVIPMPQLDILDVGTGTGLVAVELATAGHRVTGIDLTPTMLVRASERSTTLGLDIDWQLGDAMSLPFDDNEFDVTVSRHVLWTIPDPRRAFEEWMRVTRPGGRIVWFDALWPDWESFHRSFYGRLAAFAGSFRLGKQLGRLPGVRSEAAPCGYSSELSGQLPFAGLTSFGPVRDVLSELGVASVSCQFLKELNSSTAGRGALAWWRPHERYYAAWFDLPG